MYRYKKYGTYFAEYNAKKIIEKLIFTSAICLVINYLQSSKSSSFHCFLKNKFSSKFIQFKLDKNLLTCKHIFKKKNFDYIVN